MAQNGNFSKKLRHRKREELKKRGVRKGKDDWGVVDEE